MIQVDMFEVTQNYLKSKLIKSKRYQVQVSPILITTYCTSHSNSLSNCSNKMILMKKQRGKNPGGGGGRTSHMKGVGMLVGNFELNP